MKFSRMISNFSKNEIRVYTISVVVVFCTKYFFLKNYLVNSNFKTKDSYEYSKAAANLKETYLGTDPTYIQLSLMRLPGYPLFLSLFNSESKIVLAQVMMQCAIGLILVVMFRLILRKKLTKSSFLLFILTQFETSLLVYSYRILTELLFAFVLLLLIFFISNQSQIHKKVVLNTIIIVMIVLCFLIRPVAIYFIAIFFIMACISTKKTLYIKLFMVSIIVYGSYCGFNYLKHDIPVYTLIQNSNLLYYEGAGAKAISSSRTLEFIQDQEALLRKSTLGTNATLQEIDSYNFKRGIKLIFENKLSFIEMHVMGVLKLLYGPNKAELLQLSTDSGRIKISKLLWAIIFSFYLCLTFIISTLGMIGSVKYFLVNETFKLMSTTIFVFILFTSGSLAYGRFRTPISAFLIFYAVLLIVDWKNKKTKYFKWSNFIQRI